MPKEFVGRKLELKQLNDLLRKKTASMITLQGRRRIGKSTLIHHFCGLNQVPCFDFQGLPRRPQLSNQHQLNEFAKTLAKHLGSTQNEFKDWTQAFEHLDLLCSKESRKNRKFLILLDEISWMGSKDPDFAGHLKDAWDRLLSQNRNLILAVCGSVSSWIQNNILDNTGFVGRVSREFHLHELSIAESTELLRHSLKKISSHEIAQILSITGGVPKYLEEFSPYKSVETGIHELCYTASGFLFNELDAIFSDTFGKRNSLYREILKLLTSGPLTPQELAHKAQHPLNGDWSAHISNLELAGFIRRDYTWDLKNSPSKISQLRLRDNYAKFYLKYIEPQKQRINKLPQAAAPHIPINWNSVFGLQFENLILNNLATLVSLAGIPPQEIVQIGPYFQSATKARAGVQIDCLIQCRKGILHLFEFKTGKGIGAGAESEMRRKSALLKIPRGFALRHYLVHLGELSGELQASDFFDRTIAFDEFIRA